MVEFWHVLGWSRKLSAQTPGFAYNSTTISDGVFFSDRNVAVEYGQENLTGWWIKQCQASVMPEAVDYYLREGIWRPASMRSVFDAHAI